MYLYLFKLIIIGDANVGKSCLLLRFIDKRFRENHELTIGVEFGSKIININNIPIKLQIWDTAGQEYFRSITRSYYRGSIGALLVFDINNKNTFEKLKSWINEIHLNANSNITILLIGNKNDLLNREVTYDEALYFSIQHNLLYIETSAKTYDNIDNAFNLITNEIYNKILNNIYKIDDSNNGIKLGPLHNNNNNNNNKHKNYICCL